MNVAPLVVALVMCVTLVQSQEQPQQKTLRYSQASFREARK